MHKPQSTLTFLFTIFALFLAFTGAGTRWIYAADPAPASKYIWIEGETPGSITPSSFKPTITVGQPNVFSDGKWLTTAIDPAQVDAAVPDTGIILDYPANVTTAGDYDIWAHVGYEQTRVTFDWRIDQGDWHTVLNTEPTIDLQELGVWAPVAWLNLGKQTLAVGNHTLEIRLDKTKDKDGKLTTFLFGLDALCLTSIPFHPDGAIKPGDISWMTDADKAAQQQTFAVPDSNTPAQAPLSLAGQWQYAVDDEFIIDDRLGPVKSVPSADSLTWHAIEVPGNRNALLPDQMYIHRYYLRTRVQVPADLAGHSFVLHIPAESMIATVFVNGQPVGSTKDCWAVWDCDVTKAIKPGQANEIWVAFKDDFYGLSDEDHAKHLRYIPYPFWHFNLTNSLDMPVLGHEETGFVTNEPTFIVGGGVYTSDVFAIPSVKNKTLGLEITVHNSTGADASVQVGEEIQPLTGGAAEKTFAPQTVTVPAGQDVVVKLSEAWANPKLWWQDDPQQYNAVTKLSVGGKEVDERKTKFGFREWTWDGPDIKLNGIPFHGFADTDTPDIAKLREHGQTMVRVWATDAKTEPYLDECDAKGMPVRRTGIFDGEGAAGFYNMENTALWDNYRHELLAWAKGQRNHPSIFIWSMENEITFINGHVTGHDKLTTVEMKKATDLLMPLDPTRPVMTDGGNANLEETLPVYGGHYLEPALNTYPESIYDKAGYTHRQVWPITQDKPILFGETAYVSGAPLEEHATVGGPQTFLGQAEARPGVAEELRMLSEGYRWLGISFHFWEGGQLPMVYKAWQPVAVLSRQWNWTFGSGEKVVHTFGIFNDSRSTDPITFNWTLSLKGAKAAEGSSTHTIAPGCNEKFDVTLAMPSVKEREEGVLTLTLTQGGKTVFEDTKDVSILPPNAISPELAKAAPGRIALFDPNNSVKDFLTSMKIPFTSIDDLSKIPASTKVVIVGKDALNSVTSTSSQLSAWTAAGGGHVALVLEQANPLKFQGLPGQMATDTNYGCLGFPEDATNPALKGLQSKDFFTWGPDGYLYRNAYVKPVSGGKSIIQCDMKLADSALVQMQAGDGILLLSQLLIGEKIKNNPVAQHLLLNLVDYADKYKLKLVDTFVVADDNPPLLKAIDATGLKYSKAADPLAAVSKPGTIAIVSATPANLKVLATNLPKVKAFTNGGGWLILNNLTQEGLSDFNTLVGVNHVLRPFGREKISWPPTRNPLTAGMSPGDVVIGTGKPINNFKAGDWPDTEAYSAAVDYDDAAPFASSTYFAWGNAVGGFTMDDGTWQLIQNMPTTDAVVPIKLARPEKLLQFVWTSDLNYEGTTKIQLTINGKDYTFDTKPNGETQTFDIPDQPTASELTFKIIDWEHDPKKTQGGKELVGIDNIRIKVARPADFFDKVKPMLNIGALVEYPQGSGGIVLCNVKYKDSETNPANVQKKQAIIAGILRNMDAVFAGGKTIIAGGGNLDFTPIDISKQANQFRGDQGWFGDKAHTFESLPSGKQTMAGVNYDIYHFTTSVVQEAIMLGGNGVPGNLPDSVKGIPVNRKADALFFLQAASIIQKRNPNEVKDDKKFEIADYVIHYADGTDVKVPIYSEINVENYMQAGDPIAVPGAQIAWTSPYTEPKTNAVAYSMQWTNPKPDVEISSIDLVQGPDHVAIPALLAITAANTKTK